MRPAWEQTGRSTYAEGVSTRRLIILAMLCGLAIIVAFAAQIWLAAR